MHDSRTTIYGALAAKVAYHTEIAPEIKVRGRNFFKVSGVLGLTLSDPGEPGPRPGNAAPAGACTGD